MKEKDSLIYDLIFSEKTEFKINVADYVQDIYKYEDFINEILTGLTPPPGYFPKNVVMNITGYDSIDEVMARGMRHLNAKEFEAVMSSNRPIVIDTRAAEVFSKGFIPGSINIGIDGSFAVWTGPVKDNTGKELLGAGQVADDKFLSGVDFYVKGVEGSIPKNK